MSPGPLWSATTGVAGAPHVVLVHGSLDRSAGMLKLSRRLDDRYRVTRYDRRGYGRSVESGGPFGIEQQVADLMEIIAAAPDAGPPCVVFGHSYGGHVVLAAAARHPALVVGVVVYEPPLAWLDWWPDTTAGGESLTGADPAEAAERFMRRLFGDARWERLPAETRAARRAEGPALVGELRDLRRAAPWTANEISVPVMPIGGALGQPHHHQAMAVLGEWFGVAPLLIEGARHFGPNTHAEAVAEAVIPFVERCSV